MMGCVWWSHEYNKHLTRSSVKLYMDENHSNLCYSLSFYLFSERLPVFLCAFRHVLLLCTASLENVLNHSCCSKRIHLESYMSAHSSFPASIHALSHNHLYTGPLCMMMMVCSHFSLLSCLKKFRPTYTYTQFS